MDAGMFLKGILYRSRLRMARLAASNRYRNGLTFDEFLPEIKKAVDDITARYSVSKERIFLCGLSGGGMAAYVAAHQDPDLFAGVIVNDGSLHPSVLKAGTKTRLLSFDGGHGFAPAAYHRQALQWLESD